MAIKVNGTTVIDDSRNLVNIVSGAGASTTLGAVGTYAFLMNQTGNTGTPGTTHPGSSCMYHASSKNAGTSGVYASGTWRTMGWSYATTGSQDYNTTVMVRIA